MRHICLLMLLVVLLAGCTENSSRDVVVPIAQVPAPLLKVARDTLPDVTFDHARKKENGVYEIRGKNRTATTSR